MLQNLSADVSNVTCYSREHEVVPGEEVVVPQSKLVTVVVIVYIGFDTYSLA
jgi:hypothetical protein